jgi:hypothetical protein
MAAIAITVKRSGMNELHSYEPTLMRLILAVPEGWQEAHERTRCVFVCKSAVMQCRAWSVLV